MITEIENLLKTDWNDYINDSYPLDRRMLNITKFVGGMSSESILYLINILVGKFAKVYLEIGVLWGLSLISASKWNKARCIGIENFFSPQSDRNILNKNLQDFNLNNINLYDINYLLLNETLFKNEPNLKVDIFYYDGAKAKPEQVENGLKILTPYLSDNCIVMIDDLNEPEIEIPLIKFQKENPDFVSVLSIKNNKNWHNGFIMLVREEK